MLIRLIGELTTGVASIDSLHPSQQREKEGGGGEPDGNII